jgi:hypothetical protein
MRREILVITVESVLWPSAGSPYTSSSVRRTLLWSIRPEYLSGATIGPPE